MNLPQLPTDNFYKFLSIGGIAITIFSYAGSVILTEEYKEKQSAYFLSITDNSNRFGPSMTAKFSWERREQILMEHISNKYKLTSFPFIKGKVDSIENFIEFYDDMVKYEEARVKVEEFDSEILNDKLSMGKNETEAELIAKKWLKYDATLVTTSLLGIIISFIGSVLWYLKSQRYIDKQVLLSAVNGEVLKLKIESASSFNSLYLDLYPNRYWEQMDTEEFFAYIARSFSQSSIQINIYLKKYSVVLNEAIVKELKMMEQLCTSGKFKVDGEGHPSSEAHDLAEKFINKMSEINKGIKESITIYT